jgi:hypothetical protein
VRLEREKILGRSAHIPSDDDSAVEEGGYRQVHSQTKASLVDVRRYGCGTLNECVSSAYYLRS